MKFYKERHASIEALTFDDLIALAIREGNAWTPFMYRGVTFLRREESLFQATGTDDRRHYSGVDDMVVFARDGLHVMKRGVFDEAYQEA